MKKLTRKQAIILYVAGLLYALFAIGFAIYMFIQVAIIQKFDATLGNTLALFIIEFPAPIALSYVQDLAHKYIF